ncbi:Purine catabolism regulatory protein [compost metagenome]
MGVSAVLETGLRVQEALREACLALAHSTPTWQIVEYCSALYEAFWLPGHLEQATECIVGSLAVWLTTMFKTEGQLIHTLRVFLEQNRSWQKSSKILNVHKQTLIYRVRRIEEITGRSLDDTEGLVEFWIVLRSRDVAVESQS